VGQGDAFVLNAGGGHAVVIDAGPDPEALDACLTDLSVRVVELLVVTHLHKDHYAGAAGVFRDRQVKAVWYSSEEPALPRELAGPARSAGVVPAQISAGASGRAGPITWRALWPPGRPPPAGGGATGAVPGEASENDASAVLLVELPAPGGSVTALFTGDIESAASRRLLAAQPELGRNGVTILKVAHHGARNGGTEIVEALRPRLALISAGEGNDYGHPHPQVLAGLKDLAVFAARTDRLGSFTVSIRAGALEVRSLG
jgi:competence protein ComEC